MIEPILPGATIGVLGGGQLGRMFAMAARRMGYRVHTLSPDPDTIEVVPGAMTRVAAPGSRLVNISSGGVMKDTWVLS